MTLTVKKAKLATLLHELDAIKFGAFKLKLHETHPDAPRSPIYLNLRTESHPANPGPLTAEAMKLIGDLFQEIIDGSGVYMFTCIADIPDAGAPFGDQVERVAQALDIGVTRLILHKQKLADGKRRITTQVDGDYEEGETCLLVDDLVTGADTKLEAIAALEGAGLRVSDILSVVDRLQGGSQKLKALGYDVYTIFDLDELLAFYVEDGLLDQAKADEVMTYIANNQVQ